MQTIIINLSALAEPTQISGLSASVMKLLSPDLARPWYSLEAFADLYLHFDTKTSTLKKALLSCCIFGSTTPGLLYVLNNIDWNIITKYKLGEINTDAFLSAILEKMPFLLEAEPEKLMKYISKDFSHLQSLKDITDLANATKEQLAKAVIEEAWLARMVFHKKTNEKVQRFFEENKGNKIVFVANSNELDIRATVDYLKSVTGVKKVDEKSIDELSSSDLSTSDVENSMRWKKDPKLSVLKEPSSIEIELTDNHSMGLFVSYAHRAYKNGVISETSARTDSLLERAIKSGTVDRKNITVVSQWPDDLAKARELSIAAENILDADSYFASSSLKMKMA